MQYTVMCEGAAVGYVELPSPETWEDGAADGTLDALPAFAAVRARLEAGLRAEFLMSDRLEAARRDGRLPPEQSGAPPSSGSAQLSVRDITPEKLAVMGTDAVGAAADAERIKFRLLEADGRTLPTRTEVYVTLSGLPEWPAPHRPPSVAVVVPPEDDDEPSRPEA